MSGSAVKLIKRLTVVQVKHAFRYSIQSMSGLEAEKIIMHG
jgi:hypothetical protein